MDMHAGYSAARRTILAARTQHCTLYGRSRHVQLLGQLLQDLEDDHVPPDEGEGAAEEGAWRKEGGDGPEGVEVAEGVAGPAEVPRGPSGSRDPSGAHGRAKRSGREEGGSGRAEGKEGKEASGGEEASGGGSGYFVLFEGGTGSGKTRLAREVVQLARLMHIPICWSSGDVGNRAPMRVLQVWSGVSAVGGVGV